MDSYRTSLPPELDANRRQAAKTEYVIPVDEVLTVRETAAYLKVSLQFVYNLIAEGKLKAKRINGRNFRVRKTDVDRFLSH
jgi:excisionase family DNA binding protein